MHKSQLIKTLETLNSTQWKALDRFLRSPFFNPDIDKGNDSVILLFNYIYFHKNNLSHPDLQKENVFEAIFPDQNWVEGKVDKLMSSFLKLLRKFIAVEYSENGDFHNSLALVKFYRINNWEVRFNAELKKVQKTQEKYPYKDKEYYFKQFLIEKERYKFEELYNQRKGDLNLSGVLKNLDIFYLLTKLEFANVMHYQGKFGVFEIEELVSIKEGVQRQIRENQYYGILLMEVLDRALTLVLEEGRDLYDVFFDFRQLLKNNEQFIPTDLFRYFQTCCRNFCTAQYNKGDNRYLSILFDLYQKHLKSGYLYIHENCITPSILMNVTNVGLKSKEYDWVKSFLDSHKERIVGTSNPLEVYNINLANYYFHVKNYDKAWQLLENNYEDIYYKLKAKRMEIKIFFEQSNFDLMDARINAFKVFLSRARKDLISESIRDMNFAFINMIVRINNTNTYQNEERIRKLKTEIKIKKAIAEREWLLDKLL